MSDRRLRELERTWLQSGSRSDEVALLAARARSNQHGGVPRLEVAGLLGYGPARDALARCQRELIAQRRTERVLGLGRDELLAWVDAGCPATDRRYDLAAVLRWAHERDPWPEGAGPVRALAKALHVYEGAAAARAALALATWARGGKRRGVLLQLAAYLDAPARDRARTLQAALSRLERGGDPEQQAWRERAATQAVCCAARAAPSFDLNWILSTVAAAAQVGVAIRREWPHVTRHLVEADLLRAMGEEVLPWALGYAPRPEPRDRWRVEHTAGPGRTRLVGSLPRVVSSHTFRVLDLETGEAVLTFAGETERFPNDDQRGIHRVAISDDGSEALAFQLGEPPTRHPL